MNNSIESSLRRLKKKFNCKTYFGMKGKSSQNKTGLSSILFSFILLASLISTAQVSHQDYKPSPLELKIAEQVVSIFENSTPVIQYSYAQKLEDWKERGITFGRAGFTTCQDGIDVLNELKKTDPQNPINNFSPYIEKNYLNQPLCVANTKALVEKNFLRVYRRHGNDPGVKQAQENVYKRRYLDTSLDLMKKLNLKSFMAFVVIQDSFIQHGEGSDGIEAIINLVKRPHPVNSAEELEWLMDFLMSRAQLLKYGGTEWAKSVTRTAVLREFVKSYYNKTVKSVRIFSEEYGDFSLPAHRNKSNAIREN